MYDILLPRPLVPLMPNRRVPRRAAENHEIDLGSGNIAGNFVKRRTVTIVAHEGLEVLNLVRRPGP
jgi:hypothetical protein